MTITRHPSRIMAKAGPLFARELLRAPEGLSAFAPEDVLAKWQAGIRAAEAGTNVIPMLDVIGEDYWTGGGVTARRVSQQLQALGGAAPEVHINSPGGDMFEGLAIYNLLREYATQHSVSVKVKILGQAASAASVIAMAGDVVEIGAASFLMIHNCWVVAVGNRHDMARVAEQLAPFDAAMADVYAQRSGQSAADCAGWMDAETYMNGRVAIERGFADALLAADAVTEDAETTARAAELNSVRAMEMTLVSGGMTRAAARARILQLKGIDPDHFRGTPGAATETGTPGAADPNGWDEAATAAALSLIESMRRR